MAPHLFTEISEFVVIVWAAPMLAKYYAALDVVVYGRCTISSVTSVYTPPAILTKLNFVFIFVDIPCEKHASSSRMYSLNAIPWDSTPSVVARPKPVAAFFRCVVEVSSPGNWCVAANFLHV